MGWGRVVEENTSKVYVGANPLATPPAASGGGSALFVINLCASIAPVQTSGKNLPGLENYRLYQVARVEDGRTRHRLRLGFFTSESHAESILTVVRQQYPSAFTACLCDEDRRFTRGYLPDAAPAAAPATPKPAVAVVPPAHAPTTTPAKAEPKKSPAATAPAASPPAAPANPKGSASPPTKSEKPVPAKARADADIVEVTWEPPAPARKAPATKAVSSAPAVDVDVAIDDFSWQPPALQPSAPATEQSTAATAKHPVLSPVYKTQPVVKGAPASKAAPKVEPAAKAAPKAAPAPKTDPASSMRIKAPDLTFSEPPAPAAQKPTVKSNEPFHVAKGVEIGDLQISLQTDAARTDPSPSTPAPVAATKKAPPAKAVSGAAAIPVAPKVEPAAKAPQATKPPITARQPIPEPSLPELDSTQTIRALTSAELNDDSQEKWFAIQLAASEQPVNLDAMPHLDIFEAYRLYSVATAGSGKIIHSLRLGFFKEAVSAEAVAGYLKTFFGSPTVLRISVAEQARFKDAPAPKPASADDSRAPAKVVELNDARTARPAVPTVTMEVPAPRTDATGSFRLNDAGSFKPNATGTFKSSARGSQEVLTPTLKPAAKSAGPATKRSDPLPRKSNGGATGKYKTLPPRKSLSEQLLEEAREVELSESGIRKLPKNDSLLSKLVDKLTK
jgi:hypothetical protein